MCGIIPVIISTAARQLCILAEHFGGGAGTREQDLHRTKSEAADMLKLSPLDWFGKWQESSSPVSAESAVEPFPAKLGKVCLISGCGATVRLREALKLP